MVPILLPFVSEVVCNLGSSHDPWVVKDRTVEQIIVRKRRFLVKASLEKPPRFEEAV